MRLCATFQAAAASSHSVGRIWTTSVMLSRSLSKMAISDGLTSIESGVSMATGLLSGIASICLIMS